MSIVQKTNWLHFIWLEW